MFLEAFFWGDTNKREGRKFDELGKLIKKNQERKDKEDKQIEDIHDWSETTWLEYWILEFASIATFICHENLQWNNRWKCKTL